MVTQAFVEYRDDVSYILENANLRILVLPERGGKIVSLMNKTNSSEWLWPPENDERGPAGTGEFNAREAFGFDEMFPNIVPEWRKDLPEGEGQLPDHGEVWRRSWKTLSYDSSRIDLAVRGEVLPYEFYRSIKLQENRLHLTYRVENRSSQAIPALWTPHPLFSFFSDTELLVPPCVKSILQAMDDGPLGRNGAFHKLGADGFVDGAGSLFRPGELPEGSAFKFYAAAALEEGWCGLRDRRGTLMMRFPVRTLPWLGFWINKGGWGGQYNLALEPATAPMDSPGASEAMDIPARWEGKEVKQWEWEIDIS